MKTGHHEVPSLTTTTTAIDSSSVLSCFSLLTVLTVRQVHGHRCACSLVPQELWDVAAKYGAHLSSLHGRSHVINPVLRLLLILLANLSCMHPWTLKESLCRGNCGVDIASDPGQLDKLQEPQLRVC